MGKNKGKLTSRPMSERDPTRNGPQDGRGSPGAGPMRGKGPMGGGPGHGGGPMGGGPMGGLIAGSAKAIDMKGTLKKLLKYMERYKWKMFIVLLLSIFSTAASIVGPKIMGNATTEIFSGLMRQIGGTGGINFDIILQIIIQVLILYTFSAIVSYISGWIMADVSTDTSYRFRKDVYEKINRLPLKYFDNTTYGEVLSHITNDVDTINQSLRESLNQIITSIVTLVGVMVMMFVISWKMTLMALVVFPLSMVFVRIIVKKSQPHFKRQQRYLGHINGHVEEMYQGHIIMKAFNGEERSMEKFNELNEELYNSGWKSNFLSSLMMPVMVFIGNLIYVVVAVVGGYYASIKEITIGDIQAFLQYVRTFNQPIRQIAQISNIIQSTAAAAERVFLFLEQEELSKDSDKPLDLEKIHGNIEFQNVNFGYYPDNIIINNFSASIKAGQKIAIVGPTGAGKTTIVKLLMRFYEINSGKILIDGHDIREFSRHDLRRLYGMVLQDTWLYNGTIMNNIRYGRLDATDEEVIAAAKQVHVDQFVRTLPDGYNLVLNEEMNNISQGQMQLITIARALLADPKILILDEATSSVDTRTEVLIQKAMLKLMVNRTSFIIAHRLSTIRNADLILVMRNGDIVEQGTHKELLAKKGFYAELHQSQFEPTG